MKSVLAITSQVLLLCVSGEDDVTLTTAITRQHDLSIKPTIRPRRIFNDKDDGFRARASSTEWLNTNENRTRKFADIWNWDYWCQEQPQKGTCSKHEKKYYYNMQLDQCTKFIYSGCGGNMNKFDSKIDCERHCKGTSYTRLEVKSFSRSGSCTYQPDAGLCVALYDKYYYDVNAKTCKTFKFSGCGGNQNRFPTKYMCLQKCGDGSTEDE